jgi:hypothetical protein
MIKPKYAWYLFIFIILCMTTIGITYESEAQEWFFGIKRPILGFLFLLGIIVYHYFLDGARKRVEVDPSTKKVRPSQARQI